MRKLDGSINVPPPAGRKTFSIDVVDFLINDLEFPKEFTEAIERKQIATQDALAAEQRVAQSKAEAQQGLELAVELRLHLTPDQLAVRGDLDA